MFGQRRERVKNIPYTARATTGICALLGIALISTLALLVETARSYPAPERQTFDIVAYVARFAQIKADLPKDTAVGYLSDAEPDTAGTTAEFGLAQYALIPAVLANDAGRELVMANVHRPQPPSFYQARGLELMRDYGNGVMLLRKASR